METGFEPLALDAGRFALTARGAVLMIEAWDEARTYTRRLTRIEARESGRLLLSAERFGRGAASVTLLDLDGARAAPALRRNRHASLAARLGQMLARRYPDWSADQLTAGADLEHTLSPAYPRALLRRRGQRLAAICAPPRGGDHALTFGLLWLAYLRRSLAPRPVPELAIFLPRGEEDNTCLRVRHLDPLKAGFHLYVYGSNGDEHPAEAADAGNLLSRLEPWRAADAGGACEAAVWARRIALEPGVEAVELGGGVRSLRVAGLEFARLAAGRLLVGIGRKRPGRDAADALELARRLAAIRLDPAAHPEREWARCQPEARLESLVRAHLQELDPSLRPHPVYGQVCAIAGRDRGLADLLAVDHDGRLAVIEIKAGEDPHLPLQALDYWIRVSHHAAAGEFGPAGFFPGVAVRPVPPRLLLAAPALSFHPSTETLLEFFPSHVQVQRIGLGVEWQSSIRAVFRVDGASRPEWRHGRPGIR